MKKTGLISLLVVGMLLFTSCGKQEQHKPTVTDTPKKQERLSEDLKQITFRDFGIKDGPYTDTVKQGQYSGESLNGTVFCGKVTFSEEGRARLVLGGTTSQGGFALSTVKDIETGKTVLQLSDSDLDRSGAKFEDYYFNSDVAGVPLIGEELDLKLSIEFVDADKDKKEDDVKLGVWFADKLYNNEYIYLKNYTETGHSMGNWLAVTLQDASITVVSIGSVELETIPEGLRQLTIKDFGIDADSYVGGTYAGEYNAENLDGTIISMNVTFSDEGQAFLMFGGKMSWGGFGISTYKVGTGESSLRLYDTMHQKESRRFDSILFHSDVAGVNLIGEELEMKVSIQFFDHGEDGSKNDLKLGFWFNGRLYNNEYVYIDDYTNTRHSMGTWMTIRLNDNAPLTIR